MCVKQCTLHRQPFKEKAGQEADEDKKAMLQNTVVSRHNGGSHGGPQLPHSLPPSLPPSLQSKVEAALREAGEAVSVDPASTKVR